MLSRSTVVTICFLLCFPLMGNETCTNVETKHVEGQDEKSSRTEACVRKDERDIYIYSKNCKGLECKVLKEPATKPVSLRGYKRSIGSPGFKVCRELEGSPQIFSYKYSGKWYKTDRCIFEDGSFASTNLLLKLWDGYILR